MTTKAELLEQARAAELDVDESNTKAEIEEALANANTAVVRSPDRAPQHGGESFGDVPPEANVGDQPVADHHHQDGLGPELTPAGAHRHGPGQPEHNHPVPTRPVQPDVVVPAPASDDETADTGKAPAAKTWTVERDCKVVVNGQLLELDAGETVTGAVGQYLADTGAPVKAK